MKAMKACIPISNKYQQFLKGAGHAKIQKSVVIFTLNMVAKNSALFYSFIPSGGVKCVATPLKKYAFVLIAVRNLKILT
jgi:hypothetical protein